jgi:hypothetical protein
MAVQLIFPIGKRTKGAYAAVIIALADECAAFDQSTKSAWKRILG